MRAPLPLAIVVVSGVVYHLAQKSSRATRPWSMLVVAYGAAFALAVVLALTDDLAATQQKSDRAAGLLLGLAAFGIEAGFFFIYRSGWPLASASVIANVVVTATLASVGIIFFREQLTALRAIGLALAATGAALIARG